MLDKEGREKFKSFQKKTGKYDDLDIDDVRFEEISLADEEYFKFIKGKNKYIQHYIKANEGDYPILGSSLKNSCVSAYIKPIDNSDIVNQKCVSFNKDNAKGSVPFFRDYPFLMDRHHIAIIPDSELVDASYLAKSLIHFFKSKKFGWGDNVADVSAVQKHSVPIPKDLDKTYTSFKIQEVIVEYLEFWKDGYTDVIRERVEKKRPIYEAIKKIVVQNTFKYDEFIVEKFNNFVKDKGHDLEFDNIQFNDVPFFDIVNVTNGSEFPSGYVKRTEIKGKIPLISAGVKKDVMGYINSLKGNKSDELDSHYVFNDTKNKWNKVKHYIGKDFYTLNADGEGGNIIKRPKEDYKDGFYTTNVCKVLEFNDEDIIEQYFYFSYQSVKDKEQFGFSKKANNENLAKVTLSLPIKMDNYSSKDIQKLLVEFWEIMLKQIDSKLAIYQRMLELADIIDRAFLYRTFSKIDWSKE